MDALLFDLRYAARRLRQSPVFTLIVMLTLALGIGANSAIFSVVNTVLLRPLPYARPSELVTIYHYYPTLKLEAPVSAPGFRDYRDQNHVFENVAVESQWNTNLTGLGEAERLRGMKVSAQFFSALGVRPMLGRTPLADEDALGHEHVMVLSNGLWKRMFGADPSVIGRKVLLNGEGYDVIGVMPPAFYDPWNRDAEMWAPLALDPALFVIGNYTNEYLNLVARLKSGVTIDAATRDMLAWATKLKADNPNQFGDWGLRVKSMVEVRTGSIRTALLILLGAVGFVLLIACANVANLFLARAAARQKEVAIRTALGARKWPLVRQLLVESTLLSVLGGALGLLVAWASIRGLVAFNPGNIPRIDELSIDRRVVAFTAIVSLLTGVLFGVVPAIQASRGNLHISLKEGGRSGTADRASQLVRRVLVVAEVSLALTLLTGGGLLLRSFERLAQVNPGFDADNLLTFTVGLPATKYQNDTVRRNFYASAIAQLAALPGVKGAGATTTAPFGGDWSTGSFNVEGFTPAERQNSPWGDQRIVTTGYLETMRVPVLKGRLFDSRDLDGGMRAIVVDDEFVRRFYKPGEDPIGRRIWFGNSTPDSTTRYLTIVGVVGHTKHEGLDADARVQVYRPVSQSRGVGGMAVVVRTTNDPMAMVAAARRAVHSVDADVPLARIRTMTDMIDASMGQRRLSTVLLGIFAGLALLLASLGIYGVMSYTVAQRQRELGVRMALGASRRGVLSLVLRQGMTLAIVGVTIGLGGAFALTRLISAQLYDVKPTDPVTFASVTGILTLVALGASLVPAIRATRVDPMVALREE